MYSLFVSVVLITILALTPVKELIFIIENEKLEEQATKIRTMEDHLNVLKNELNKFVSEKARLKYALMLGLTDSIDSNSTAYDSLKYEPLKNRDIEGNVLASLINFVSSFFESDSNRLTVMKPSEGFIINGFNPSKGHMGIDFSAKNGSPVYASMSGLVLFADYTAEGGNTLIIQNNNDYITIYKHCSILLKSEREYVNQGELIAESGNTGYKTTGPHLHFELWFKGEPIDPTNLIINLLEK